MSAESAAPAPGALPRLEWRDLGRRPYRPVLDLQERLVTRRREGAIPDTLLLVEHEPVYTLGRSGDEAHVLASPAELAHRGIELVHIGRGGDVTYHGPGQLVGYPILDLAARGGGVVRYVGLLEEVLISVLAEFGVAAGTDPVNRGVWVGREKIAAIGVRVTRHVTMHGFSLNVATDLSYYRSIVPCGLADRGVTSLDRLRPGVTVADLKPALVREFARVLGYGDVAEAAGDAMN